MSKSSPLEEPKEASQTKSLAFLSFSQNTTLFSPLTFESWLQWALLTTVSLWSTLGIASCGRLPSSQLFPVELNVQDQTRCNLRCRGLGWASLGVSVLAPNKQWLRGRNQFWVWSLTYGLILATLLKPFKPQFPHLWNVNFNNSSIQYM